MPSPRILRSLDVMLGHAEAAVGRRDWDGVADAARRVLAVDDSNEDALSFLSIAGADLGIAVAHAAVSLPTTASTRPLLIAIEDEVQAHPSAAQATPASASIAAPTRVAARTPAQVAVPGEDTHASWRRSIGMPPETANAAVESLATTVLPPAARGEREATTAAPYRIVAPDALSTPTPSDAGDAGRETATRTSRRRRLVIIGSYEAPRFAALPTRGPLVLTAGIIAATIALTFTAPMPAGSRPLLARTVESAAPADAVSPPPVLDAPAVAEARPELPATATPPSVAPIAAPPVVVAPIAVPPVVVAPLPPAPRRYQGALRGTFGRLVAVNGCEWDTPFEASVEALLTRASDGRTSGTATSLVSVSYVVTNTPVGATCNGSEVSAEANGPIAGNDGRFDSVLVGPRELAISFSGASSGEALVGDATVRRILTTVSTFGGTAVTRVSEPISLVLRVSPVSRN